MQFPIDAIPIKIQHVAVDSNNLILKFIWNVNERPTIANTMLERKTKSTNIIQTQDSL